MSTVEQKIEFERHVKQNMKKAYFSALGILRDHDLAMEASQSAFVKAYKSFGTFDKTKNFFTWYYKILRNNCLNIIRDNKKLVHEESNNYLEYTFEENDLNQNIENREIYELTKKEISNLETTDREVLILREFEGYSYEEISEMMQIPIGTVMSKIYYARKKIAKRIGAYLK